MSTNLGAPNFGDIVERNCEQHDIGADVTLLLHAFEMRRASRVEFTSVAGQLTDKE